MNVLSLFNGMSCGMMALEKLNVKVDKYYSSEIDKYANQATQALFPDVIQLGDVTKWRDWDVDWCGIDFLIGGSPCQGFSFAGHQAGTKACIDGVDFIIETRDQYLDAKEKGAKFYSQSHLFWEYVLCLDYAKLQNPKVEFLLENVKMKKELLDMITGAIGVKPILINSALVSAQNRNRYYWCSFRPYGQPEDKGIMLADIIEVGVVDRDKPYCIDANYWKGTNIEQYIKKSRRQVVFMVQRPRGNNPGGVRAEDGKTPCLSSNSWEHNNHLVTAFTERRTEEAKRIRKEFMQKFGRDFSPRRAKEMVAREDGKMNCLTATYSLKEHTLIDEKLYYRKLTPRECMRLQTIPEYHINTLLDCGVSNTQLYKMTGNGWTVDVIAHLFKTITQK